jgi:hypothetical protein
MKLIKLVSIAAMLSMMLSNVAFADSERNNQNEHRGHNGHYESQPATAVPEPEIYGMMLAGLGLIGFAARRKFKIKAVKE